MRHYWPMSRRLIDQPIKALGPERPMAVVYVLEGDHGETLYIGQTSNWPARRSALKSMSWWPGVARVHLLRADDEPGRVLTERDLITLYQPPNNVEHTERAKLKGAINTARARTRQAIIDRWNAAGKPGGYDALFDELRVTPLPIWPEFMPVSCSSRSESG